MIIHKKIIYDEEGKPTDVLIKWEDYLKIEEKLGLDIEEEVKKHLKEIKKSKNSKDYISLEEI